MTPLSMLGCFPWPPFVTRLTGRSSPQPGKPAARADEDQPAGPPPVILVLAGPNEPEPRTAAVEKACDELSAEELATLIEDPNLSDEKPEADPTPSLSPPQASASSASPEPPEPPAFDGPAVRLFDPAAARRACGDDEGTPFDDGDERATLLREMATDKAAGYRPLAVPQAQQVEALRALAVATPHLAAVIYIVADAAGAAMRQKTGFACPPLLIAGPPGVGKTRLISVMTDILQLPVVFLDGSAMDDTAALAGHSRSWRASRPGTVARELIRGTTGNAALVIDEIDKAEADSRYGPTLWHVLHGLLEPETAHRWEDSCLEVPMNLAHLVVMATANDVRYVPSSLLDRFLVLAVEAPGESDLSALIQAVSAGVAAAFNVTDAPLAPDALPLLAGLPPRRLRTILRLAWAKALAAGQGRPGDADIHHAIRLADAAQRRPIGFTTGKRPSRSNPQLQPRDQQLIIDRNGKSND